MKKIISISLIVMMIFGCFSVTNAEGKFSDVDETRYSWAISQIEEMAEKSILNGYPDGTFMPENKISKMEAMLLISRILGINEDIYSEKKAEIYSLYADDLDDVDFKYKEEISFLIYKNVFTADEIIDIVEADEYNAPLYRDEVAEYITRAMGAYETAKDSNTGYADEKDISEKYRPFVKFVKDKGIMQGMTETEFMPAYGVNRVQMAVMMYRVLNAQNLIFMKADYVKTTSSEIEVKLSSGKGNYDISEAEFYINGEEADADELKTNAKLFLVFENGVLKRVETIYIVPETKKTVTGEVKEIKLGGVNSIKIADSATDEISSYEVSENCEVYVDDEISTLSLLRTKDNAKLYIDKNDVVFMVEILDVNGQFKGGIIDEIIVDDIVEIVVDKDDKLETYSVDDDVIIKRNSKDAELKDILEGDEITLCTTTYNKITRLEVKSEIGNASGKIVEVVISKNSSIVVDRNGSEKRYPINDSIKIYLDGKESQLYDLRVDMPIDITTDSGTVTKIEVESVDEVGQITGEVESVNTSYGFINVKMSSGSVKQVFVTKTTKITADGAVTATKTIKNIKVGSTVVVIGKTVNGAFQATTIVTIE